MVKSEGPKKPTVKLQIRVRLEIHASLKQIKEFTNNSDVSEMVRGWLIEKVNTYKADPKFQEFVKGESA